MQRMIATIPLLGTLLWTGTGDAQDVALGETVLVMEAPTWGALAEPHLAAHPTDPDWLVGGVIVQDTAGPGAEQGYCGTLLSTDGGRSWETGRFPAGECADPWVAVTGSDEAVYLALGPHDIVRAPGSWPWGLLIARSADGGRSWNDTIITLGSGHDRPVLMADPRPGEERSVVVVSGQGTRLDDGPVRWSVYVARSVDAAASFRLPENLFPSNLNLNAAESVILADGIILVSYVDFMRNADGFGSREGMLERRRIWMYRSTDEGRTFSMPLFVTEHCGMSSHDVAADRSGGSRAGRVYLACRAINGPGLLIHHSDDRGETWSAPRPVPGSGEGGTESAQPRLAVNGEGTLGVAWIETEGGRTDACNRRWVTASTDGGETFSTPLPLSPRACPDAARNGFVFRRWPQGGDYFGWTAAADGRFHAVWSDARRGPSELWSRTVTVRP